MDVVKLRDALIERLRASPKIVVYVSVVVLCVMVLMFMGGDKEELKVQSGFPSAETEYARVLEKQLESVISKIKGVGSVKVMVTVESTVSYEFAQDISSSATGRNTEIVIVGNDEALIKKINNPKVSGVLVICDGGDSIIIKEKITNAVSTVLDISSNKVYITK